MIVAPPLLELLLEPAPASMADPLLELPLELLLVSPPELLLELPLLFPPELLLEPLPLAEPLPELLELPPPPPPPASGTWYVPTAGEQFMAAMAPTAPTMGSAIDVASKLRFMKKPPLRYVSLNWKGLTVNRDSRLLPLRNGLVPCLVVSRSHRKLPCSATGCNAEQKAMRRSSRAFAAKCVHAIGLHYRRDFIR